MENGHNVGVPRTLAEFTTLDRLLRANSATVTSIDLGHLLSGYSDVGLVLERLGPSLLLNTDSVEALLRYIESSSALTQLGVVVHPYIWHGGDLRLVRFVLNHLVHAVGVNTHIRHVSFDVSDASFDIATNVLRQAPHIEHFFLSLKGEFQLSPTVAEHVFDGNETVREVTLSWDHLSAEGMINAMLPSLALVPSLAAWSISSRRGTRSVDHVRAVEEFVRVTTAKAVSLGVYCYFDTDAHAALFASLAMSPSISCYSFTSGYMNPDATDLFVQFVRGMGRNEPKPNSILGIGSALKFNGRSVGRVVADGLKGSLLSELRLSHVESATQDPMDLVGLFQDMTANESEISLSKLVLDRLNAVVSTALTRFLPKSTGLSDMTIQRKDDGVDHRPLIKAIQENASLLSIHLGSVVLSATDSTRLASTLQRNKELPQMIANPKVAVSETEREQEQPRMAIDMELFPALFCAALKAERMAPKMLLSGLLPASDEIMPTALLNAEQGIPEIIPRGIEPLRRSRHENVQNEACKPLFKLSRVLEMLGDEACANGHTEHGIRWKRRAEGFQRQAQEVADLRRFSTVLQEFVDSHDEPSRGGAAQALDEDIVVMNDMAKVAENKLSVMMDLIVGLGAVEACL